MTEGADKCQCTNVKPAEDVSAEDVSAGRLRERLTLYSAAQMVMVAFSSVKRRRNAVNWAMKHTKLTREELEKAQKNKLLLPTEDCKCVAFDKVVLDRQVDIIANLALPMRKKRELRDFMVDKMFNHLQEESIYTRQGLRREWEKMKAKFGELNEYVTLWKGDLKKIEGLFGGGVLMYFSFLRWLFLVNVVIFILVFFFATTPQLAFPDDTATPNWTTYYNTTDATSQNIKRAVKCSALYVVDEPDNPSDVQPFTDFLLGTGWMEKKIAFYGAYKDNRVLSTSYSYNLPLAYILVVLSYFFLSLVFVVRKTANTVRDSMMDTQSNLTQYSRLAFTFWDYSISDEANSTIMHKNIIRENKDLLEENQRAEGMRNMSTTKKVKLWVIRIGINILVIGILALACYIVFLVVTRFIKVKSERNYKNKSPFEQLSLSFMVSLTITALNSIVPFGFKKMVPYEKYSFADEVNITLARTVVLKLVSLVVLVYTIHDNVNCSPKDECNVGTGDCSELRCWETRVGQEFYKLVLVDAVAVIAIVLFVELPRKLIENKEWRISKIIGVQEFDIPKNILDLIYTEVLVWFGTFFAPMIPLMTVLKLVLVFYFKKLSLMYNFTPSSKTYRVADSYFFVQIVLLGAYVVCITPIMYVVWSMPPSTGCGPFRSYDFMYETLSATIHSWPPWLEGIADFLASTAFSIPAFTTLALTIYYMRKVKNTHETMIDNLRTQLLFVEKKIVAETKQSIPRPGGQEQATASHTQSPRPTHTTELTEVTEV